MNINANFEHRAGSSQDKHEGESSLGLCDRLDRTRDNSQRQLPTDHDYAVPTREYQTDQSSLNLPRLLLALSSRKRQRQLQKHPHRLRRVDTVTPYRAFSLNGVSNRVEGAAPAVAKSRTSSIILGSKLFWLYLLTSRLRILSVKKYLTLLSTWRRVG